MLIIFRYIDISTYQHAFARFCFVFVCVNEREEEEETLHNVHSVAHVLRVDIIFK